MKLRARALHRAILNLCALNLLACGGAKPAADKVVAPSFDPNMAIMATSSGLVAIDEQGAEVGAWAAPGVSWCATDPRSGVVWLLTASDDEPATLWTLAPTAGAQPVEVASGLPRLPVEIIYPDGQRVAMLDEADYDVAIALTLGADQAPASVAPIIGCGNSMSADICFIFDGNGQVMEADGTPALNPDIKAQREAVRGGRVTNPALLKALAARGGSRPLWTSTAPKPAGMIEGLDLSGQVCEGPEVCAEAVALTNTPYQLVITASSMGDLPHNDRQLYDPEARGFFHIATPATTSPKPLTDESASFTDARIIVSPSGQRMLIDGELLKLGSPRPPLGEEQRLGCGFMGASALISPR